MIGKMKYTQDHIQDHTCEHEQTGLEIEVASVNKPSALLGGSVSVGLVGVLFT